jgi:hypothetical protein
VEIRGRTIHAQAKPKAPLIIEFQWPQIEAAPQVDPVVIEPVEPFYADDLRSFMERPEKEKP